ncbi:MAG TPA: alpha/beta hydrolase [Thermoleophilaceae bacterium]|jgi:pimeloyl-ACP methyl ester carboxylesterase
MPKKFAPPAAPAAPWRARRADADYGVTAKPDWREIDWLAHLRQADVGGMKLNYVDIGPTGVAPDRPEREPVVFVHGLGGQWQNWLENIPRVALERRVIAPDLPGFGISEPPPGKMSIPGYGSCVDALCDQLGLGEVAMVGNSMGGFITAEVAIQFPARVSRLVLVSAAGISSAESARAPILTVGRVAAALATYAVARYRSLASRAMTRQFSLALVARHPALLRADLTYEGFYKGGGKPGLVDALRANLEYDFRERLPDVRVPTLIVWGEKDSVIPVRDAQEYERLIPDSRKLVMRDTGHVPMAERPTAFNDALMGFLEESGPAEEAEAVEGESAVA